MKVEIVYKNKKPIKNRTVEFSNTKDAFEFIFYNQPIEVIAIRITT